MLSAKGADGDQRPRRSSSIWWPRRLAEESFSRLGKRGFALALLVSALGLLAGLVLIEGPTAAETDSDGDGFTDAAEALMGTDPLRPCSETTTANDEAIDAWPPDFNDDTKADIADVVLFRTVYGSASGDGVYSPRFDLTTNGTIDIADILLLRTVYGSACEPTPPPAPATSFLATFDGDPPAPKSIYNMPGWDTAINTGNSPTDIQPMLAQHGPDCAGPPATHEISKYDETVYQCKNHIMMAIKQGYGVIYLTPAYLVDFSQGEAVIRFDRSTLSTSNRDWTDFWITPFEDNLMFPLEEWQAFLTGEPRNSVHMRGAVMRISRDFDIQEVKGNWWTDPIKKAGMEHSPTRRDTFEIRISRNHISFCMPGTASVGGSDPNGSSTIETGINFCFLDKEISPALTWDKGVFQLGHHTYNATKGTTKDDCSLVGLTCPTANTWHWDNVEISPAVPFTIIHSDRRWVDFNDPNPTVNFDSPAPANAFLRFSAGRDNTGATQISFDGGQTWVTANQQPASKQVHTERNCTAPCVSNYWHPIPEGTTSVQVRAGAGTRSDWFAKDFTIWSLTVTGSGP